MTATHARQAAAAALVAALTVGSLVACDTLECGDGTHREGDTCVPNVQVACGDDTVFEDGKCVLDPDLVLPEAGVAPDAGDPLMCGPGTKREGDQCVPDGPAPRLDMGAPGMDMGAGADMGGGTDDAGPETDGEPPVEDMGVEPDAAPPMRCAATGLPGQPPANCGNVPGTYCVVGTATDFLTGCALPADANLIIALIDPIAAAGGAPPLAVAPVGEGGTFALQASADAAQLAIVIDEAPMAPEDNWTRSVSGVLAAAPALNEVYRASAFASDQATQGRWNTALGLGEGGLEARGFLVGRVLQIGGEGLIPLAGAAVRARNRDLLACEEGDPCLRFFGDDPRLIDFQDVGAGTTGASGGFLLIHDGGPAPLQDIFYVQGREGTYDDLPAGANRGSGFHTALVPRAARP